MTQAFVPFIPDELIAMYVSPGQRQCKLLVCQKSLQMRTFMRNAQLGFYCSPTRLFSLRTQGPHTGRMLRLMQVQGENKDVNVKRLAKAPDPSSLRAQAHAHAEGDKATHICVDCGYIYCDK